MSFSIKAKCQYGELLHRRKTAEAALKKAREMSRAGCYDIYITTPEGRDAPSIICSMRLNLKHRSGVLLL